MYPLLLMAKIFLLWFAICLDVKIVGELYANRRMNASWLIIAAAATTAFVTVQWWL